MAIPKDEKPIPPKGSKIEFRLCFVTPETAARWLAQGDPNRTLREFRIVGYARDIKSGNWAITHQMIAFDSKGRLIDGQHRLAAIVRTGIAVWSYVAKYEIEVEAMNLPLDNGLNRDAATILGEDQRCVQVAQVITRLKLGDVSIRTTPAEVGSVLNDFRDDINTVMEIPYTRSKHRGTAAARAMICILINEFRAEREEILDQYRKFITMENVEGMWSSTLALFRNLENLRKVPPVEVMLRIWIAFNPTNRDMKVIRLMNPAVELQALYQIVKAQFGIQD